MNFSIIFASCINLAHLAWADFKIKVKELGEYFHRLYFWNQWVPLIKMHCRVRYLFDFDLKIHSGQVCAAVNEKWVDYWKKKVVHITSYGIEPNGH